MILSNFSKAIGGLLNYKTSTASGIIMLNGSASRGWRAWMKKPRPQRRLTRATKKRIASRGWRKVQ